MRDPMTQFVTSITVCYPQRCVMGHIV